MKTRFPYLLPSFSRFFIVGAAAAVLAGSPQARAETLPPDTNFHAPAFAAPNPAQRTLLLPDGKYLLFYNTDTLTDQRTGAITRFLANGTIDASFNFSRVYGFVGAATVGPAGKLYVAAGKNLYNAPQSEEILRLNDDGSIDGSFTAPLIVPAISPAVRQIRVQADGKVLIAGPFLNVGAEFRPDIARLLSNGALDSTFNTVALADGSVQALTLQPDGKILIGGDFFAANNIEYPGVARLETDGSVDSSFQPTGFSRFSTPIRALTLQGDSKILVGGRLRIGDESSVIATPLFRLEADGSPDASFTPVTTISAAANARDILLQPDGKIVAAIDSSVYRFNANGSLDSGFHHPVMLDTSFDPAGFAGASITLGLRADGRFLVGGAFTDVDATGPLTHSHFAVVRLNANGTLDSSFSTSHKTGYAKAPGSFFRLADGSVLVGFDTPTVHIDPAIPYNFGRLLADGSLDPDFTLTSSAPNELLSNFIASGFSPVPGGFVVFGEKADQSFHVGKISADGVVDESFADDPSIPTFQNATALPDGKILLAAGNDPQSTVEAGLTRLRVDGHVDATFQLDDFIRSTQVERDTIGNISRLYLGSRVLAVQADGKILFEYFAPNGAFQLVRLNADGSTDIAFVGHEEFPFDVEQTFPVIFDPVKGQVMQPFDGAYSGSYSFRDVLIQPDGKIVVAGQFTSYGGTAARGLVRLMPDGAVDTSFHIGGGAQWTSTTETASAIPKVENVVRQGDGRLLITGTFEAFNGVAAPGIVSLNPNGSVDTSFVPPATRDKYAPGDAALARQGDGSFLLSGPYSLPGETSAPTLVHILGVSRVGNISTRVAVGADDKVLIGGFIVSGHTPKQVLIRAIGPSLNVSGAPVPGRLMNPVLELHGAGPVVTNDDWRATQEQEIISSTVAPTDDHESAIVATLDPGAYTAVVLGKNGGTGIGLVEVYDLGNPSALTGQQASLANISTRGFVQTGDNVMIGGFIITGAQTNVIVRAIGPELTDRGVPGAVQDTTLELFDANGLVASNDDWRSTQEQEIIASTVPPNDNRESAIVASLAPGGYTAIVRGKGGAIGVALVEVFSLP